MKLGTEEITTATSGKGGSTSAKEAAMARLVNGQTGLKIVPCEELTEEERIKFAPKWGLHGKITENGKTVYRSDKNRAVVNGKGELVLALSHTMTIYFSKAHLNALTKASKEGQIALLESFVGKSQSYTGKAGFTALTAVLAANKPQPKTVPQTGK